MRLTRRLKYCAHCRFDTLQQTSRHFLKRCPIHLASHILVIHKALDVEWNFLRVGTHQLLQPLTLRQQAEECTRVPVHVEPVVLPELLHKVLRQQAVELNATKVRIVLSSQHLDSQRNVSSYSIVYMTLCFK